MIPLSPVASMSDPVSPAQARAGAGVSGPQEVEVDGVCYTVGVAGSGAGDLLTCVSPLGHPIATYAVRRRIRLALRAETAAATLVFTDAAHSAEVWTWVDRGVSYPHGYRERLVRAGYRLEGHRPPPGGEPAPIAAAGETHVQAPAVMIPLLILRRLGREPAGARQGERPWQLLQQLIEDPSGPDTLRRVWRSLTRLRVLDSNCGTGDWLLAALAVLEHVYLCCVEQMRIWVAETRLQRKPPRADVLRDFRRVLARAGETEGHHQPRAFAREAGVLLNLHGVARDAREAAECRRRMAATLRAGGEEGRLPKIALSIRAGDPALGISTRDELRTALASAPGPEAALRRLCEEAEATGRADRFLRTSRFESAAGGGSLQRGFHRVRGRVRALTREMDALRCGEGADAGDQTRTACGRHPRPLHLFAEWHSVIRSGGFDLVRPAT